MKVFISWSGQRSRHVAEAIRRWLPSVVHGIDVWISSRDLEPGSNWHRRLFDQLAQTSYGLVIVTAESATAPWVLFEAGAVAKYPEARLIPLLVEFDRESMPAPLQEFTAERCDREGMWDIVRYVAAQSSTRKSRWWKSLWGIVPLPERQSGEPKLADLFSRQWPDLERELAKLPPELVPLGDLMASGTDSLRVVFGGEEMRQSEPGEVNALAGLYQMVGQRASHHVKTHFDVRMGEQTAPGDIATANVIFIGGPCVNEYTQSIMRASPIEYLPSHRYSANSREYANSGGSDADGVFNDYAAMIRVPNPYCLGKVAVVLAGLSSWGTEGCVRVIASGSSELDSYASGESFAAIVHSVHRHGHIVSAKVVWHQRI